MDIKNYSSLTDKWDEFETLINRMVHTNHKIRPDCSQILNENAWSISLLEIDLFNLESEIKNYPDHFLKSYFYQKFISYELKRINYYSL